MFFSSRDEKVSLMLVSASQKEKKVSLMLVSESQKVLTVSLMLVPESQKVLRVSLMLVPEGQEVLKVSLMLVLRSVKSVINAGSQKVPGGYTRMYRGYQKGIPGCTGWCIGWYTFPGGVQGGIPSSLLYPARYTVTTCTTAVLGTRTARRCHSDTFKDNPQGRGSSAQSCPSPSLRVRDSNSARHKALSKGNRHNSARRCCSSLVSF